MTTQSQSGGPATPERPRRTRAERFREIRDAIMAQSARMKPMSVPGPVGGREMRCGSFYIQFHPPGAFGPRRGSNLAIWPDGVIDDGHLMLGDKVANVDWDQHDTIDILSFRSGPWEGELLCLLRNECNLRPFG